MDERMFDLFIKAKREVLRQNSKILSSFVGLFWFNEDCTDVVETRGMVEFTETDVSFKKTVLPEGTHASYKGVKRGDAPRGRVELNDGVPTISVGENCSDKMVDYIVKFMGLNGYQDIVEVRRGSFWDKKR